MSTATKKKTLAETIREHVGTLQSERAALVTERDATAHEIEALYTAPVSRADALQFCLDYIDARAAAYLDTFGHLAEAFDRVAWPRRNDVQGGAVGYAKGAPLCLRDIDAGTSGDFAQVVATFRDGLRFFGAGSEGHRADEAAYFFFGDIIKAKVREHFDRLYPGSESAHPAATVAERRERIAALRAKIEELNADIAAIDAELTAIRQDTSAAVTAEPVKAEAGPALPASTSHTRDREIWHAVRRRGWHTGNGEWVSAGENAIAEHFGVSREYVDRIAASASAPAA